MQVEVCLIHGTEGLVFKVCLLIMKAEARLVGGHSYMTLISLMDVSIDVKTALCHIMFPLCFVHL